MAAKRIRIPVKLLDGHWELLYGGAVRARNGSTGVLSLSRDQIEDEAFLKVLSEKHRIRILDEGTELRVALTVREKLESSLYKLLVSTEWDRAAKISVESQFVPIWLGNPNEAQVKKGEKKGGLWLELQGMEPRGLESSTVTLPEGMDVTAAISVNHAFTLLSERFEPWRKSHTGNIYERVFYGENDGRWYRLGDLREREMAQAERAIIKTLWQEVARMIGKRLHP